jgi:hypothetical protein
MYGIVVGVEEGSVIGELGKLVIVTEAAGLVADVAGERNGFAGRQRLIEGIDGIKITRR